MQFSRWSLGMRDPMIYLVALSFEPALNIYYLIGRQKAVICEYDFMKHNSSPKKIQTSISHGLCRVAHAQALDLGLLKNGEKAWEVEDWMDRVNAFEDGKT